MGYEVHVLHAGYSGSTDQGMVANCSCTLIRGRHNIIVDTMTPWDKDKIVSALSLHKLTPEDIQFVVCTHGHSDHVGNNNLFLYAKHIVGFSVSFRDQYSLHPFEDGQPFVIDDDVKVIPTPGHTNTDVSVIVRTRGMGTVAIVGDLFEKEEDLKDASIWRTLGGSENPRSQERYRNAVLLMADYIVPGHGPMFSVTLAAREEANKKSTQSTGQVNYLPPSFIKSGFAPPTIFDTFHGSRWLDDTSSSISKLSRPSCSPQRCWEDRLTERAGSGIIKKSTTEISPKQDLYSGLRDTEVKSFYESGSRSLDTRDHFDSTVESRKMREAIIGDSMSWEKKRFPSDNILYSVDYQGTSKHTPDVDSVYSSGLESCRSKHMSVSKLGAGDACSSNTKGGFESSQVYNDKLSRVDWQSAEGRFSSDDKNLYRMGESQLTHSRKLDFSTNSGTVDGIQSEQSSRMFSSDKIGLTLKDKSQDDKREPSISYSRNFSDKIGRGDCLNQDDTLDRYKLKQDTKSYDFEKADDRWRNEKVKKETRFSSSDDWGSVDRSRRSEDTFQLGSSDAKSGIVESHNSNSMSATVLISSSPRRDDRFNRVIT